MGTRLQDTLDQMENIKIRVSETDKNHGDHYRNDVLFLLSKVERLENLNREFRRRIDCLEDGYSPCSIDIG